MTDARPRIRRRAVTLARLLFSVVLAVALVAGTVALTRSSATAGGRGAPTTDTTTAGAHARPLSAAAERGLAAAEPPQRGLAAAAVAAAQSTADRVGFPAGPASAAPIGSAVAVLDRVTSEVAVGEGGSTGVLSASLSKLVLAVDILDRRQAEGLPVTDVDVRLLQRALGPSDDAAMSALWSRFDGPGAAPRLSARLGLQGTLTPADPSQWGEMVVTASDLLLVWQHVLGAMPTADRDFLVVAMAAAPAIATDGFDQAYGLLSPGLPVEVGAAKQGWMCCIGRADHMHTAGVVGPQDRFVVAVLTTTPTAQGSDAARTLVDRMVAAATETLAPSPAG